MMKNTCLVVVPTVLLCVLGSGCSSETKDPGELVHPWLDEGSADSAGGVERLGRISFDEPVNGEFIADRQFDGYELSISAGAVVTIANTEEGSAEGLDTALFLYGPADDVGAYDPMAMAAFDDDSGGGDRARIDAFNIEVSGTYLLVVGTFRRAGRGAYRLVAWCESDSGACSNTQELSVQAIQDESHRQHPELESELALRDVVVTTPMTRYGFWASEPEGGAFSGVFIYIPGQELRESTQLSPGDVVDVIGTYKEYHGKSEVVATELTVVGNAEVPDPVQVTPDQICTTCPEAEAFEGVLVQVHGVDVVGTAIGRGDFLVATDDSGTGLIVGDSIHEHTPVIGEAFAHLEGVLDFSNEEFRLEPRTEEDFVGFDGANCSELCGTEAFRDCLLRAVSGHQGLSYADAREELFGSIHNRSGQVECVYTGEQVTTSGVPEGEIMNTEHTWCRSWGANAWPAETDLHHLFPTTNESNSRRSSLPFGEVVDPFWSEGGSAVGRNASLETVFEPRDQQKGNAARAMFYFGLRYQLELDEEQEHIIRSWNVLDPPDDRELLRNDAIEALQGRRNPFIDNPDFVECIADL